MTKSSSDTLTLAQLSALAQATRYAAFRLLMRAGRPGLAAGDISHRLGVAPNTLSSHLQILVKADLAGVRRDGRSQIYSANIDAISSMIETLVSDCCQDHPEVCASLEEAKQSRAC